MLNVTITVAQIIGGLISNSLALLSDALHNFSDVISLIISYIAIRLTQRSYSHRQTFGFKRAEIIAALINAVSLLVIAIFLVQEALTRFNHPVEVKSTWIIGLAIVGILGNGISVLLLQNEAKTNLNIKSAYLHLFSDMVTSVAVLLGGIAMLFYEIYWIDNVLSILIAIYLVILSWQLLVQTLRVLMQFAPDNIDLIQLEKVIIALPEVENIHHVHLWQLNDDDIHFEAHIDFKEDLKLSQVVVVMDNIKHILMRFNINHIFLQPEIGVDDDKKLVVDEHHYHEPDHHH